MPQLTFACNRESYSGFNRVLPLLCVAWGLCTTFQGFVTNYAGLAICRAVLGACEGAILPGCVTYLSEFYRRKDLGFRTAFFFSAIALAGAFSGLLAAAILNLDGKGGKGEPVRTLCEFR